MQLRRPPESQGQPSPAGLEPGPFERAEAERGAADDHTRAIMAEEAQGGGRAEGIAGEPPPGLLESPELHTWRLLSGHYRHHLTVAGQLGAGTIGAENQLPFPEEVHAGMVYTVRAIRVIAPAGARLLLYENNTAPTSFREVITSVQLYSGEPPGTLVFRGATRLIAVITNTSAEGLAMVRLEGDLVKHEPVASRA